ncbi:MAG: phosphatidate cytidylyltransferase [Halomonadaceae bacterium]|nr:MAG: phosphatidate cytidylyltransferase [Halomonadaceae bacterium]
MLKQRIITALILAPIVVGGLFFLPPMGFALFTAAALAIAGWEWANMAGFSQQRGRCLYAAGLLLLMGLLYQLPAAAVLPVLWLTLIWWLLALALVIAHPRGQAISGHRGLRLLMGVPVLVGAWLGLNHLRAGELTLGQWDNNLFLILYTFVVVWGADIGAYFTGRHFGGRKLAPHVSPGKSWAGVYGGLAVVLLLAMGVSWLAGLSPGQAVLLVAVSLFTAGASVLGDLLESLLKRVRGIKDSSQLLPGHGGVMDRVDSLVAAIPVLAFCFTQLGWLTPVA